MYLDNSKDQSSTDNENSTPIQVEDEVEEVIICDDQETESVVELSPQDDLILIPINRIQELLSQVNFISILFSDIHHGLNRQEEILTQLYRQHGHCRELLNTFEDFLTSFETESSIYCGNWFAQLILLKVDFDHFDRCGEILIQRLNRKMEICFDQFNSFKDSLLSSNVTNLDECEDEINLINNRVTTAQFELDDIIDYLTVQTNEQRTTIPQYVKVMVAICHSVEAVIVCENIPDFDCFNSTHFLQQLSRTLLSIQII